MSPDDERYPAGKSPIVSLAEDYKSDLNFLRSWRPAVIVENDIAVLVSLCLKHGLKDEYICVDKKNFFKIKGILENQVLRKYEQLVNDYIDKQRELTPSKLPKDSSQRATAGDIKDMYT